MTPPPTTPERPLTIDPILVWDFDEAPEEFQQLSQNGGDEDWLAVLPVNYKDTFIPWLEDSGGPFGVCCVDRYELSDGRVVVIGSHA